MMVTFSIVINTLNRGSLLQRTLESFRWLKYDGNFEVIVVNGPSTDNSDEVIASWLPRIRAGKCDVANLSVSRNIGICMAQGDIVVFIDDDAIPEPEWLTHLAKAYDSLEIGGAGGLVFDQTGYTYQYQYSTANRLAKANWAAGGNAERYCFPGSFEFPYLQGTNASFRRSALLEVGGFDEEIEYYLDETELCCRLIDAGYVIRQLPNAYVHHKFAPSNIRDEHKITRYRYPVIKNKIYFSLKHARNYLSLPDIVEDNKRFSRMHEAEVEFHIIEGRLKNTERERFYEENKKAWKRGSARGLSGFHELITIEKLNRWQSDFCCFRSIASDTAKTIVLVSRDFPPNHGGGIATFTKDLAEALAAEGNLIHVITQSTDINRVDFENGVWVHRMVMRKISRSSDAIEHNIPQHIWDWSATALEEARRIATHRIIDVVETPIWDCEGVAFLLDGQWPLVTSLQTTLHFWLDSRPELRQDLRWMQSVGLPMLAMEKELMLQSSAIRSISSAIKRDIESAYGFAFEDKKVCIAPLGMPSVEVFPSVQTSDDEVTVLFVGRLEYRKGIDVLLEAIPRVLERNSKVRFRILGDDTLPKSGRGVTYKDEYFSTTTGQRWSDYVQFEGRVDNDTLRDAYKTCDIFVAPSRFESFGLIFLEAMREGKPVVGCLVGGMPEIISKNVNGLLIQPGDADELAEAILLLAESNNLRTSMGDEGRRIFLEKFTSESMAKASSGLYDLAQKNFHETRCLKISYIHGICLKNDAISNSIRDEITWLRDAGRNDVRLYAYACDHEDLPFTKVKDLNEIALDQHYQSSDLVVFHFGIFYPLFNLLFIASKKSKRLVVFHNITPKQFVSVENHSTVNKSFQQMANIVVADHVACVSQTNLDVLRAAGIHTPATILPLAVCVDPQMPVSKPSAADGLIRVAFVGRFVRSKGPGELLDALDKVLQRSHKAQLKLDMIGSLSFSDSMLLAKIRNAVEVMHRSYGDRIIITIHGDASEEVKQQILFDADLFVLPTYHEGFCLPILESLASGCKVIAYKNSNTPAISGGLAKLTPTGDIEALSCAIAEAIAEISSYAWRGKGFDSYTEYTHKARQYVQQYSPEQTKQLFLTFINNFVR